MQINTSVKLVVTGLLTYSSLSQIFIRETWWFIQNVNLIFHEAGHILFIFFGSFMSLIGGSLLEILIPLLITGYFIFSKQIFSSVCTAWWLSTAFLSVSIYAADARERSLQLITNDPNTHDWFNILLQLNLLRYDVIIGYVFWCASLLSVGLMLFLLTKDIDVKKLLNRHRLR